jgi:hypothetical protein
MVKRIVYILAAVLLCGCEVIREEDRLIPVAPSGNASRTHVLIEYTGFLCVNCPNAAETAQTLIDTYGEEQLIVVAMHPATNHFTQTKKAEYDYTCSEADSCYLFMGGTVSTPFPTGNIDAVKTENGYFIDPKDWAAQLQTMNSADTPPYLEIEAAATDTTTRVVELTMQTYAESPLECRMALWLVEDSVPGAQMMPNGKTNTQYYHRHMLRSTAGGSPWGKEMNVEPVLTSHYAEMTVPEKCDIAKCAVVAVLMDKKDYHILQAKQIHLQ